MPACAAVRLRSRAQEFLPTVAGMPFPRIFGNGSARPLGLVAVSAGASFGAGVLGSAGWRKFALTGCTRPALSRALFCACVAALFASALLCRILAFSSRTGRMGKILPKRSGATGRLPGWLGLTTKPFRRSDPRSHLGNIPRPNPALASSSARARRWAVHGDHVRARLVAADPHDLSRFPLGSVGVIARLMSSCRRSP